MNADEAKRLSEFNEYKIKQEAHVLANKILPEIHEAVSQAKTSIEKILTKKEVETKTLAYLLEILKDWGYFTRVREYGFTCTKLTIDWSKPLKQRKRERIRDLFLGEPTYFGIFILSVLYLVWYLLKWAVYNY